MFDLQNNSKLNIIVIPVQISLIYFTTKDGYKQNISQLHHFILQFFHLNTYSFFLKTNASLKNFITHLINCSQYCLNIFYQFFFFFSRLKLYVNLNDSWIYRKNGSKNMNIQSICVNTISQFLLCLSASMTAFYRLSFPVLIVFDGLFTAFVCVCFVSKYLQDSLSMSFIMYLDNFIRVFLKLPYFLIYNQSYVCISLWLSVCLPSSVIFF